MAWVLALIQVLTISFKDGVNAQEPSKPKQETLYIMARGIPNPGEVDGRYVVSENREVHLLWLGKVKLPEWGCAASALAIQKAYRNAKIYTNIEVFVGPSYSDCDEILGIDISGEVKMNRSSHSYHPGKTKLSGVLERAMPKESADLKRIEILRNGQTIVIDATLPDGLNTALKNNDIITVRAKK
jgi:hypothetical protein